MSNIYHSEIYQLLNKILQTKKYMMALVKRLAMVKINYASKTEYERNEIEIVTHETRQLIAKTLHNIGQQEKIVKQMLGCYYEKVCEVDSRFEELVNFAKQNQNISIKHILYDINWKKINESYQDKISIYENLKRETDLIKKNKDV